MASYYLSVKTGGKGNATSHADYIAREGKYIALTIVAVMGSCLWGMVYFIDSGYDRIVQMQRMEDIWEQKAPLADISTCNDKPCVQVTGNEFTNKKGERFYQIKPVK